MSTPAQPDFASSVSSHSSSGSTLVSGEDEKKFSFDSFDSERDVEKAALIEPEPVKEAASKTVSRQFVIWILVNVFATIGIVFTNKAIFSTSNFRMTQSSFAAFHFTVTGLTLFIVSRPPLSKFVVKRPAKFRDLIPLSMAMCLQVILPNLSLAFSSVAFYQIARILLTPTVALIRFLVWKTTIPRNAALTLVPLLAGVGIVVYFDTQGVGEKTSTSMLGVIFALTGVLASSIYTIWVATSQKKMAMNGMQLLFNQAPLSAGLLLYVIPFTDKAPVWSEIELPQCGAIALSGVFAALINISQFYIIAEAGPVSSTVVGHLKTISIVTLGWIVSGKGATDGGIVGVLLAIGSIVGYSYIMYQHSQRTPSAEKA